MTWGEIQISALEKMFAKDEPISVDDLDNLREDDDTEVYLSQMPKVANEAIQRIKPYAMNEFEYNTTTKKYDRTTVPVIADDTADSYEVDLDESACVLISLYIASELYKDDDISLATQYRNEFEAGLQDLYYKIENQDTIREVY